MYAYYMKVPRILILGENPFIPSVESLEIFYFCIRTFRSLVQFVLTYTHTIRCLLNVFDDILYNTLSFTLF